MLPCLPRLFVSCLFTFVKCCADLLTICPRSGYQTNTNQHRFNLLKYTTKAATKKIFFHLIS